MDYFRNNNPNNFIKNYILQIILFEWKLYTDFWNVKG